MRRHTRLMTVLVGLLLAVLPACAQPSRGEPSRDVPTGPGSTATVSSATDAPAPSGPYDVGRPKRVEVPALDLDESLTAVGLAADGAMEMPDFGDAAWYDRGPRPGRPGGAVVVAHVHGPDGPDLFAGLAELRPGDEVTVHGTRRSTTFVVTAVVDVAKERLPYARIWPESEEPLLRLITCGGERDAVRGYPDNTIVYARLA